MNENTANLFKKTNTFVISKPKSSNPLDTRILIQAVNDVQKVDPIKSDEAKIILFEALLNINKKLVLEAQEKIKSLILPGVCLNFALSFKEETRLLLEDFQYAIKESNDVEFMSIFNEKKDDASKLYMVFDNNLLQIEDHYQATHNLELLPEPYKEFLNLLSAELYGLPEVFLTPAFEVYSKPENQTSSYAIDTKKKQE